MTVRPFVPIAVALAISIVCPAEAADFTYSASGGPGCTNIGSKPELSSWRCLGPRGYSAIFTDAGNMVTVEFGPTGREKAVVDNDLAWQGAGKGFGEKCRCGGASARVRGQSRPVMRDVMHDVLPRYHGGFETPCLFAGRM